MRAARVIRGDSLGLLPRLPAASFDLVVTSPHYGAGKAYEGKGSLTAYAEFAAGWLAAVPRLLKPRGSLWINVGYAKLGANETLPLAYLYHRLALGRGLRLVQEVVWHFEGGMPYKRRFAHRTERLLWFTLAPEAVHFDLDAVRDPSLNRTRDRRNNPLGKNPTDYWYFPRVGNNSAEKTRHPCQFPEPLVERIVRACCPPGGRVLDPFAGSGTSGAVAVRLGRRATLIERDASYAAIAAARVAAAAPGCVPLPRRG